MSFLLCSVPKVRKRECQATNKVPIYNQVSGLTIPKGVAIKVVYRFLCSKALPDRRHFYFPKAVSTTSAELPDFKLLPRHNCPRNDKRPRRRSIPTSYSWAWIVFRGNCVPREIDVWTTGKDIGQYIWEISHLSIIASKQQQFHSSTTILFLLHTARCAPRFLTNPRFNPDNSSHKMLPIVNPPNSLWRSIVSCNLTKKFLQEVE